MQALTSNAGISKLRPTQQQCNQIPPPDVYKCSSSSVCLAVLLCSRYFPAPTCRQMPGVSYKGL